MPGVWAMSPILTVCHEERRRIFFLGAAARVDTKGAAAAVARAVLTKFLRCMGTTTGGLSLFQPGGVFRGEVLRPIARNLCRNEFFNG